MKSTSYWNAFLSSCQCSLTRKTLKTKRDSLCPWTERNGQFWVFFTAASCFVLRLQVVSDFAFCCGHSWITKKYCILIYFQWFIKKEMCLLFTMLMIISIWISTFKQRPFCLCSPGTSTLLSVKLRDTQDLTTAHISLSATKIMAI